MKATRKEADSEGLRNHTPVHRSCITLDLHVWIHFGLEIALVEHEV